MGDRGLHRHRLAPRQRLVADGETVVEVPAKLSAQVRVFATGQGRKTDPVDAHSVALVGLRTPTLRPVRLDDAPVALRLLVDHRDELGHLRTTTVNRLHRLLLELLPGGAKKFLSAAQARTLLAPIRPRDVVGQIRQRLAQDLITELELIDQRIKIADKELRELVTASGSTLLELFGIGPSSAARLLGDVGDIARFADKGPLRLVERHSTVGCLIW
jgi:transposase